MSSTRIRRSAMVAAAAFVLPITLGVAVPAFADTPKVDPYVGEVVCQGEDLGRWVTSVRHGWAQLTAVHQWLCEQVLGIEPADEDEKPKARTSQADKWAMHLAAAEQFFAREGHLTVPRKHVETITLD
ncbi:hypothetical protein [Streptomyces sp. NPDC058623]|uniref:hypothetical protein n=1 Tax=Streptomyces sp. NPDC058623 TaxID=3346563 RepID=UPI00364D42FD